MAYLERIEHFRERYRCVVYAYVLMSNHVHLPIETGAVGLSKVMQGIQFSYTQRCNRTYRALGHLFHRALVYAAREWCGIKAKDSAGHLHRDASMISRLHTAYAAETDKNLESELQRWLKIKSTTRA